MKWREKVARAGPRTKKRRRRNGLRPDRGIIIRKVTATAQREKYLMKMEKKKEQCVIENDKLEQ